jgi:2-succinyl-5-enolpyruvyl-6-hydroxy-3-cyclohexene-1-carboxylate synthase
VTDPDSPTDDSVPDDDVDRSTPVDSSDLPEAADPARAPNPSTLWGRVICEELAAAGIEAVCFAPGSRSTPLTAAAIAHPALETFSHLDERSAAFFALGRGRRGALTALFCTSGTATAQFHPAVIEANQANVPLFVLTADRPPELIASGANQTIDQEKLYGDAVRWYRDLPEPAADGRTLRSLRTTVSRALSTARGPTPGPVHLNVRLAKPLEPTPVEGFQKALDTCDPLGVRGREGPFVTAYRGRPELTSACLDSLAATLAGTDRGLLVAGPADPTAAEGYADSLAGLARASGFPVLADPLSGLRFGPHTATMHGGYDSYLAADGWPDPDLVFRTGASPTSKVLRQYLRDADAGQIVVDPAGKWPEATFSATDLVVAGPTRLARGLTDRLTSDVPERTDCTRTAWTDRFDRVETRYWDLLEDAHDERFFEGTVLRDVAALAPDPSTLFVSNSMAVRDLDRFARPRGATVRALANRGASGIDGITSSALGAGSVDADPLVLVLGDLAYYHDMNGLLAVSRCGVDATIVLIDNDGGGIFHMLPIAEFDPPFTEGFVTPHGLDFAPTGDLYALSFTRATDRETFRERYAESLDSAGTQVIAVPFDSTASHAYRETVHERVCATIDPTED